jgi:hypothetical protein
VKCKLQSNITGRVRGVCGGYSILPVVAIEDSCGLGRIEWRVEMTRFLASAPHYLRNCGLTNEVASRFWPSILLPAEPTTIASLLRFPVQCASCRSFQVGSILALPPGIPERDGSSGEIFIPRVAVTMERCLSQHQSQCHAPQGAIRGTVRG